MKKFFEGFFKQAAKLPGVACVAVIKDGRILMGPRRDSSKWTNPGGHLNEGEKPRDGAVRELFEEAGIKSDPSKLEHVASENVTSADGKRLRIYAYKLNVPSDTATTVKEDPDAEVARWRWVKLPLSTEIMRNLHSPKNVLLKALGLQKEQ